MHMKCVRFLWNLMISVEYWPLYTKTNIQNSFIDVNSCDRFVIRTSYAKLCMRQSIQHFNV